MKEARVDEVFESISEAILIQLSDDPKHPIQLLDDNIAHGLSVSADLEIKSSAAENAVITIINKFMQFVIDETVQDIKYNWLDPDKIHKHISQTKLTKGKYEPGLLIFFFWRFIKILGKYIKIKKLFSLLNL